MNRRQVVRSQYDKPIADEVDSLFASGQQNLRNRVASVIYQDTLIYSRGDFESPREWSHATHVSYDMHGNVKELVQDNPALKDVNHQYKKLVYEYDLISGNVNKVSYQPGMPDQFFHRYEYDADNRIVNVFTSKEGLIWDNDAKYQYYKHGPLARTELGDLKVQGIDYAYTLQGWIKAVNANDLDENKDMGSDGKADSDFAKDAFGYSLHYNANDYKPIGGNSSEQFLSAVASGATSAELFNGNISKMATAISNMPNMTKTYKYDELNRLIESNTFENGQATEKYKTSYQYDANGNILNLKRNGNRTDKLLMDNLTYHYAKDGNGNILNNRLLHVNDLAEDSIYKLDIDDQDMQLVAYAQNDPATQNYKYDKIGNLIADKQDSIAEIVWTVTGKVQEVRRTPNCTKPDLLFGYDGFGNRISKTVIYPTSIDDVKEVTTYYVRDMQGNTMAVYEKKKYADDAIDFALAEQHIYGSSRLGMRKTNLLLVEKSQPVEVDLAYSSRVLGEKQYELTNHLSSVLAVISDKKILNTDNTYNADIVGTSDYFPFGMTMPGRMNNGLEYRFGFNTQEKVSEISTDHYTALFWEYDSRIGRRWNIDPMSFKYAWQSPYVAFNNNPIRYSDPRGLEGEDEVAPAGHTKNTSATGSNLYLPTGATTTTFSDETAKGKTTGNSYGVTKGGVSSFTIGEGDNAKTYNAMFNPKTGNFVGYKTSSGEVYNNPTGLKSEGTVAKVGFGETRGLYPSSDGSKVGANPANWDYQMSQQLMEARAAIEVVSTRNKQTHPGATPSPKTAENQQRQFAISENFPTVPSVILNDPNVKYFYLSSSPTSNHGGLSYKYNDITLVKSYGPFYNAGSGGDAKGTAIYINFYSATPKKN